MLAIKGKRSYKFTNPNRLWMEFGERMFGESLGEEILKREGYTDKDIEKIYKQPYSEYLELILENSKPSDFIGELQRQGYFLEYTDVQYVGMETETIDEDSFVNYTHSELLEEVNKYEVSDIRYKGKLIDLLYFCVQCKHSNLTMSDFFEEICEKESYLNNEYELIVNVYDAGIGIVIV